VEKKRTILGGLCSVYAMSPSAIFSRKIAVYKQRSFCTVTGRENPYLVAYTVITDQHWKIGNSKRFKYDKLPA
jgi:hypothetical protein